MGRRGERGSKIPLCPQILYLMLAVSFYSLVTQDDPKCHSLGKHRNESPQSLTGTVKVSESHGCGKPLPPSPRQMQAEQPGGGWGLGSEWGPPEAQVGMRKGLGRMG